MIDLYKENDKEFREYFKRADKRAVLYRCLKGMGFTRSRAKAICEEAKKVMGD